MNNFNFIIPVAGRGKRLGYLTDEIPKPLVEVNGKKIIDWQIENLPINNINKLVFVTGYRSSNFIKYIKSLDLPVKTKFYHNDNYNNTNCAYSLLLAIKEMEKGFILMNCDLITTMDNILNLMKSEYDTAVNVIGKDKGIGDLQRVYYKNNNIKNWSINLNNYNAGVIGPIKVSRIDSLKIINFYNNLEMSIKKSLHCFSLFGSLIKIINYYPIHITNDYWAEIDSIDDINKLQKHFVF